MFKIGDVIVNKVTGHTYTVTNTGPDNLLTLINTKGVLFYSYLNSGMWERVDNTDNTPTPKETFVVVDSDDQYIGTFDSVELAENEIQAIVSNDIDGYDGYDGYYHDLYTTYTIAKIIKTVSIEKIVTYNLVEVKE